MAGYSRFQENTNIFNSLLDEIYSLDEMRTITSNENKRQILIYDTHACEYSRKKMKGRSAYLISIPRGLYWRHL